MKTLILSLFLTSATLATPASQAEIDCLATMYTAVDDAKTLFEGCYQPYELNEYCDDGLFGDIDDAEAAYEECIKDLTPRPSTDCYGDYLTAKAAIIDALFDCRGTITPPEDCEDEYRQSLRDAADALMLCLFHQMTRD